MRKTHHTLLHTVLRVYDTGVKREHPAFFLVPVKHWIGYHDHLHTPGWSGSGCDVCSSCSRLTEHCTILSSVILKILKSATTNQTVTGGSGSNYSIRVLKENIANAMQYTHLLAGDIFVVCCAECCSVMTVQGHCRVSSGDHYTQTLSPGAGDHDNAASLMTWTTCETQERHMRHILIWEGEC